MEVNVYLVGLEILLIFAHSLGELRHYVYCRSDSDFKYL